MEEKKIESEWDEDESKKNKKWIESFGFEHLPVEERRTNEERRKIFTDLLTETSRKRYGSTSTRFFFTETCFLPKISEIHSLGVMKIFWNSSPLLYIGKKGGACFPEASWGRFLSAPQLLSSPPFRTLRKSYGSLTKAFWTWFSSFFSSLSQILSEIC